MSNPPRLTFSPTAGCQRRSPARKLQRRNESENEWREQRHAGCETEHLPVDLDSLVVQVCRHPLEGDRQGRQSKTQQGRWKRNENTLEDVLTDDAEPAGADSQSDAEFFLTCYPSRRQQQCDTDAPGEQHQ